MTQHIDTFTSGSGTFTEPAHLISSTISVTVIGGQSQAHFGAQVTGRISPSLLPVTYVVGTGPQGSFDSTGGDGFSGGGGGSAQNPGTGGGGSSAVLTGAGALLIEAGGANAGVAVSPGVFVVWGGTGGGYASSTPPASTNTPPYNAGSGGCQGGNGGTSCTNGTSDANGGTGAGIVGSGANGTNGTNSAPGAGVGSGGQPDPGGWTAASFADSSNVSFYDITDPISSPAQVSFTYNVADAPSAPDNLTPLTNAFVDTNADGITLGGTYRTPGSDTGALAGVAVSLKIDGGTVHYWDGTDFSSPTPVYVIPTTGLGALTGQLFSVTIPAGVLADGHTYTWALSCQESFADLDGAFSATQTFDGVVAPSVVITAPAPIEVTLTPTVSWTPTTPAGEQISYRFVAYLAPTDTPGSGTPVYDTGVVAASFADPDPSSFTVPVGVLNSVVNYYGYLQIVETGAVPSAWTPVVFTVQLVDSTAPTLMVSATTEPASGRPTALLIANVGTGGTPNPSVQFQVSADGGNTWTDIVGLAAASVPAISTVAPVSSLSTACDMGAPFNVALSYRARNVAVVSGETYVSAWTTLVDVVTIESAYWWMVPPADPTMAIQLKRIRSTVATSSSSTSDTSVTMPAMPAGISASLIIDEPEQQGRFNGFGRPDAIVIHGDIWDEEFVLNCYFDGEDEFQAFRAVRNLQQPVLLASDMSGDLYWVTLGGARPTAILSEANRQVDPKRGLSIQCIPSAPVLT